MRFSEKIIATLILFAALVILTACDTDKIPSQESSSIPPGTYTISFNSQFTDLESETTPPNVTAKTVTRPATTIDVLPTDPVMSGYKFGGWWTIKGGYGQHFTAKTTVYADRTVYAYWYKYKVTYRSDDDAILSISMTTDNTVSSLPSIPKKEDSVFAGWWTQQNGDGTQFLANTPVTADITVYAKWIPNTNTVYTVTYDSNGGTAVGIQYVTSPATTVGTLPTPDPTKPCQDFLGWWTQQNDGGTQFHDDTPVTADITVYAKWSSNTVHTIIYNSGRGSSVATQCVTGSDPDFSDFTLTSNGKSLPSDPSKRCYVFTGWWTGQYGKGEPFNAATIVDGNKRDDEGNLIDGNTETPEIDPVPDGQITVYAHWTWKPYTPPITYEIGDPGPSCVGKVFYVTDGGHHGLEAAPPGWNNWYAESPDPSLPWISGETVESEYMGVIEYIQHLQSTKNGNTSTVMDTGLENTNAIIKQVVDSGEVPTSDYAAHLCKDYSTENDDDWFLPSKDELAQLFLNRDIKRPGGFADVRYWSSSEYETSSNDSWSINFKNGEQHGSNKPLFLNVRPVRPF